MGSAMPRHSWSCFIQFAMCSITVMDCAISKSILPTQLVSECTVESLTWSRTCNLTKLAILAEIVAERFSTHYYNNLHSDW